MSKSSTVPRNTDVLPGCCAISSASSDEGHPKRPGDLRLRLPSLCADSHVRRVAWIEWPTIHIARATEILAVAAANLELLLAPVMTINAQALYLAEHERL